MSLLEHDTVRFALTELDGWELEGDTIRRELRFGTFREAIAFINRVADLADAANHHPELTNVYATVTIVLTTHDAGGVTAKDLDLAREIDRVV
ncbi:MAG: 4a-hydroxytetrahydrobiopterin dehydratase [Nitriliruptoraceae bacterium]